MDLNQTTTTEKHKMEKLFEPVTLRGDYCTLMPLSMEHLDDLVESVKDGELWKLWYAFVPEPEKVRDNIELRLKMQEESTMVPLVVIDNTTKKPVGMTGYLNIDKANRRVDIGGTW